MKRLLIALLLLSLVGCGGTKFYFLGVDADLFKEAKGKDWVKAGAGIVASAGTHVLGHYVAGEVFNVDFEFQDYYTKEHITNYDECSETDLQWFARGGFVLQHAVGTALTSFEATRYSYFTKGYVATSALQTWLYPVVNRGRYNDFRLLEDNGGDPDLEYSIYSVIGLHNVLRVPWTGDKHGGKESTQGQ